MGASEADVLYTVGHSSHALEHFLAMLARHGITAVADVRSSPYSGYCPQFNREALAAVLGRAGVEYVFLGKELGARPDDPSCRENGRVQFSKLAAAPAFQAGIERLRSQMQRRRTAVMCSEKDPLDCHRTILICRHLAPAGVRIRHVLEDGGLEEHAAAESRLIRRLKIEPTLFDEGGPAGLLERAYDEQARRIARRAEAEPLVTKEP
jgi:uncharacterized protein (DUF488 family)